MITGLHLILGGSRSGKSRRAEELALNSGLPVVYIATYATPASDSEMQARVDRHRERRPASWETVENRFDLENLILETRGKLLLLDCLTLWISFRQMQAKDVEVLADLEAALARSEELNTPMLVVSNEVGGGLVPLTPEARRFRDLAGMANQLVARHAATVELVVAGLPLILKGGTSS